MEGREGQSGTAPARYTLPPSRFASEDILFCIDVDNESPVEMKGTGTTGRPFTRLDSIKQAILLFMHAKLSINSDHRFAFTAIGKTTFWLRKEFSSDIDSAIAAFRGISEHSSSSQADLTQLFRAAAHEAKKSRAQNRILRVDYTGEDVTVNNVFVAIIGSKSSITRVVKRLWIVVQMITFSYITLIMAVLGYLILLYCRSSVPPQHQWPASQKLFTLDVMYLHDKPGPENCPQKVYDALVDALEQVSEYEGYIFESGQGLTRILFRHMCVLLSHPQQRCVQDDIDTPKSLTKKSATTDAAPAEEIVPVSSQ